MLQGLIAKKAIDVIIKQVMKKREINKLRKYVEEDNELDVQMKQLQKTVAKQGKYIEELEKEVAILNKNTHPPIFSVSDHKDVLKRLKKLENAK
tara:strand:+ start:114 stop:395 length:282 start_codon:yes stop_codon:yes gene_type:complete